MKDNYCESCNLTDNENLNSEETFCENCNITDNDIAEISDKTVDDTNVDYILYSTGCEKCIILEDKMTKKNLNFNISNNVSIILEQGFRSAPVLYITKTKEFIDFSKANKLINSL